MSEQKPMRVMVSIVPQDDQEKNQVMYRACVSWLEEQGYEWAGLPEYPASTAGMESASAPLLDLAGRLWLMAQCDGVCFAPGFSDSINCSLERLCAEKYGLKSLFPRWYELEPYLEKARAKLAKA